MSEHTLFIAFQLALREVVLFQSTPYHQLISVMIEHDRTFALTADDEAYENNWKVGPCRY